MILQFMSYAAVFVASFLIVKATFWIKNRPKLPPGPVALPVIGHLHLLRPLIHQTFQKLSSTHGPLMCFHLGSVECVVASNPEFVKELLKTYELTFSARKHSLAIDHLTYNSSFAFAPYGPYWKFIKKLSTFELLGNRTLGQFLPVRTKELHHFISFLLEKSKAGETVHVTQELLKLTNNIISQMMLSMRCSGTGDQADEVKTLVREVTEIFREFNISDIIWFCKNLDLQGFRKRFEDIHRRYDALLESIIRDREEVRKNKKKGKNDEVKDFLDMMLDVMEDKQSELQFTRNHIKALILECKIKGYTFPVGSLLFVNIWAIGRDPRVWKDPFKFQPERFLKSNEADNNSGLIDVKGFHYQLLPFGTGRRGCPGSSLAMQEMPTTLAALIQCFDWKIATPNTGGIVDMTERPGPTAPRAQEIAETCLYLI